MQYNYGYTGNNPVNATDPSGQVIPECLVGAAIQMGFGYATSAMGGRKYTWQDAGMGCVFAIVDPFAFGGEAAAIAEGASRAAGEAAVRDAAGTASRDVAAEVAATSRSTWPNTAAEMDKVLGQEGTRIPDGPTTPGRNKTVWQPSDNVKITHEQHPYHPNAPEFHRGPHWHLDTPGQPHQRYSPGDPIPGM